MTGSDQKYLGRRDVRNISVRFAQTNVRFAQTHVRFAQAHDVIPSSLSPSFLHQSLRYFTMGILKKIQGAVSYLNSTVYWVNKQDLYKHMHTYKLTYHIIKQILFQTKQIQTELYEHKPTHTHTQSHTHTGICIHSYCNSNYIAYSSKQTYIYSYKHTQ